MRRTAAVVVALAALAGCGDDDGSSAAPRSPTPPTGPDDLVIQVSTGGGLIAPQSLVVEIPAVSVYGDGTFIVPGPTTAQYPGPAWPHIQRGRISEEELQELLQAARNAGFLDDEPPDFGEPGVSDAPSTDVVVDAGGDERAVSIYALDFVEADDDLDPEQRAARERARDFIAMLPTDATEQYPVDAIAVLVSPYVTDEIPFEGEAEWPLGSLAGAGEPIEGFSPDSRCLLVTGTDDPDTVRAAAQGTSEGARWYAEGESYNLVFRPLLPHETESGCDNLQPGFVGA